MNPFSRRVGPPEGVDVNDESQWREIEQPDLMGMYDQMAQAGPQGQDSTGYRNPLAPIASAVGGAYSRVMEGPVGQVLDAYEQSYMAPAGVVGSIFRGAASGDFSDLARIAETGRYEPGDVTGNQWADIPFTVLLDPMTYISPGSGATRVTAAAGAATGSRAARASRAVELAAQNASQIAESYGQETAEAVRAFAELAQAAARSGTTPENMVRGVPAALVGLPRFNYYRRQVDELIAAGNDPRTWRLAPTRNPIIEREMTYTVPKDVPPESRRALNVRSSAEVVDDFAEEGVEAVASLADSGLELSGEVASAGVRGVDMSPGWSAEYNDAMARIRANQERVEQWYRAGAESPNAYWYDQQEVLDSVIDAVAGGRRWTQEVVRDGRAVFMMLNDLQAMASPGSTPPTQLRRALYIFEEMIKGTPISQIQNAPGKEKLLDRYNATLPTPARRLPGDVDPATLTYPDELPPGMGSNKWKGQRTGMARVQENVRGDPRQWSDPEQVFGAGTWKTSGYSRALGGDLGDVVADMHYARALMHTEEHYEMYRQFSDLRSRWDQVYNETLRATDGVGRGKKRGGNAAAAERAANDAMPESPFTMRDVRRKDPETGEMVVIGQKKGKPKYVGGVNEIADPGASATYAAQRDFGFEMAEKYGVDPGVFQARVWVGAKDFTGVVDPTAFGQLMWQRLAVLGAEKGTDSVGAFRRLLDGSLHITDVIPASILMDMLVRTQMRVARAYLENELTDDGDEALSPELYELMGGP